MVSVIVPVYNCEKYICKAVDSALAQAVPMEIIVIDDCSSDNSLRVLVKHLKETYLITDKKRLQDNSDGQSNRKYRLLWQYSLQGSTITFVRCKKNKGVAYTRNLGVRLSKGEYVAFLDSDDWWAKDKLKKQLEVMEKYDAVLCNTSRELYLADGTNTGICIDTPLVITYKMLTRTNYINCSSVLVRRDVIFKYAMIDRGCHEDYLTWLKILRDYGWVVGINEPLLNYRLSRDGKSRNKLKSAMMTYRTYRMAGYGSLRALFMMFPYTYYGIFKYKKDRQ